MLAPAIPAPIFRRFSISELSFWVEDGVEGGGVEVVGVVAGGMSVLGLASSRNFLMVSSSSRFLSASSASLISSFLFKYPFKKTPPTTAAQISNIAIIPTAKPTFQLLLIVCPACPKRFCAA